jgi:hypothetical protein
LVSILTADEEDDFPATVWAVKIETNRLPDTYLSFAPESLVDA